MLDQTPTLDDTTVFVTTIGDEVNFNDCMAHLRAQSVRFPIEIIDHVAPMSAAFQQMHDRCRTEYYVQVDEDMILFPRAIETLRNWIASTPKKVALVCAALWDCDAEHAIMGVKIYRSSIVKRFPYRDTVSCEIEQLTRIKAAGYEAVLPEPLGDRATCLGEHGKHYTPETIFKRWQRCFQKHHHFGTWEGIEPYCRLKWAWVEPYPRKLLQRYLATGAPLHLYAFLGAVAGIAGGAPADREINWRDANQVFEGLQRYFPVELTEYIERPGFSPRLNAEDKLSEKSSTIP
jgi:hypothetical protein